MTDEQLIEVDRCRRKRYSSRDICKQVGITDAELQAHISAQKLKMDRGQESREPDPTPEEIEAACAPLREAQKRNPRYDSGSGRVSDNMRMPRHFANVPAELW